MKTKIFTPLFLLVASSFLIFSCSKQEHMQGAADGQLQTSVRRAQKSVKDSLLGSWYLLKVEEITIDKSTHPWKTDTVTNLYGEGDYAINYYNNGTGMEFVRNAGSYTYIPFTFVEEPGNRHIKMTEESPGSRVFDFGVHFPNQNPSRVHLTQRIKVGQKTLKTIWHMMKATS